MLAIFSIAGHEPTLRRGSLPKDRLRPYQAPSTPARSSRLPHPRSSPARFPFSEFRPADTTLELPILRRLDRETGPQRPPPQRFALTRLTPPPPAPRGGWPPLRAPPRPLECQGARRCTPWRGRDHSEHAIVIGSNRTQPIRQSPLLISRRLRSLHPPQHLPVYGPARSFPSWESWG